MDRPGVDPGKAQILLAEDEPSLQKLMKLLLEDEGYRVTTASNGRAALARLLETPPDLLITDYMMPEMNGAELIERTRDGMKTRDVPILLMSAAVPPKLSEQQQPDAFLLKGSDLDTILAAVAELLRQPEAC